MYYGLWRYWVQAKKELLTLGSAFGLLFAFITLLAMVALGGAFSKGNQQLFAVGVQNSSGSLSHISPFVSEILDDIAGVQNRLVWSQNNNQVELFGQEQNLTIIFTNSQYLSMLKPKFFNGAHRYQCDPKCTLVGAAVAAKFGQPETIRVGGQLYEVTATFDQDSFEFPGGQPADIILDISQFAVASSMSQMFTMMATHFTDISAAQIADFIPVFRTLIEVSPATDHAILRAQVAEAYDNQKHLFGDIRRMISLLGSDDKTLGLIQGPFFDQKAKDNMQLMQMLFLVAALQLFLVTVVNIVSVITRFNLMRAYENSCRYALGGHRWSLFLNNIYFIQPIMWVAAGVGLLSLGVLHALSAEVLKAHLAITLPPLLSLVMAFAALMVIVALCLPALLNVKVLLKGLTTAKTTLTRATILQVRGLNILLFALATISVFLALSTFSHWQALKQRGTENILPTAQMIHMMRTGEGPIDPRFESVMRAIEQRIPTAGFLSVLPGDRNLGFKSLQFNDEQCQAQFDGWENRFYGSPFAVITGQDIHADNWGPNDVAISQSVLAVCGFDAQDVLGRYLQDAHNNRYQIQAVVNDLLYDVHVATPPLVIYLRDKSLLQYRNIVIPEHVDLAKLSDDLERDFVEYNLALEIREQGTLADFIASKLTRETTTMVICFILMGLSLSVLFLAFTQHIAKVLLMRNREWGTQRAMGANRQQLSRALMIELGQEWGIALLLSAVFAVSYAYLQQHLLSANTVVTLVFVLLAATGVLAGAGYYAVAQLRQQCRLTPANLLRSES